LPKEHRVKLMALAYRRLLWWIKWQAAKRGVVVRGRPKRHLHNVSKVWREDGRGGIQKSEIYGLRL